MNKPHRVLVTFEIDAPAREDAEEKVSRILDMLEGDFVADAWIGISSEDVAELVEAA